MQTNDSEQMDQLAELIGFNATLRLIGWIGGRDLTVPATADPGHPLALLLGQSVFIRLVRTYGGKQLPVPAIETGLAAQRWDATQRAVWEAYCVGRSNNEIGAEHGVTERRVRQLLMDAKESGLAALLAEYGITPAPGIRPVARRNQSTTKGE